MPKKRNFDSLNVVFNIQRLFGIKGNTRICVHYLKAFFEIYIGNNKASLFAKSLWINYFEKAKK